MFAIQSGSNWIEDLPRIRTMLFDTANIQQEVRNSRGDLNIDFVASKVIIDIEFDRMDDSEMAQLQSLINQTFFNVRFSAPETVGLTVKTFRCARKTAPALRFGKWDIFSVVLEER